MPKDFKMVPGITSYEVHEHIPDYGWTHKASYRHPDDAKAAIQRAREAKKGYKNLHDKHARKIPLKEHFSEDYEHAKQASKERHEHPEDYED